ncbi:MAG: [LysW]-aminoadipate/[LysW]-glutamate kinase [Candidatus Bathyarchaeia archaeon]
MVVIIKLGGRVMDDALSEAALNDLETVSKQTPLILVHGGGNIVTRFAEKLGVEQKFVTSPEGFRSRYTDSETMQIYTMVMAGQVNKEIVRRLLTKKIPSIGLSGLDGALIRAERKKRLIVKDERGRRVAIEGGYTGTVKEVDKKLLVTLLDAGYVPVIAPIALGEENEALNIDGDRTAAHIAGALHADLLLLMTDVEGVSLNDTIRRKMTANEAKNSISSLGPGMITKVYAALEAISMGVSKVTIAPGAHESPFTSAMKNESGTVITN